MRPAGWRAPRAAGPTGAQCPEPHGEADMYRGIGANGLLLGLLTASYLLGYLRLIAYHLGQPAFFSLAAVHCAFCARSVSLGASVAFSGVPPAVWALIG